MIDHLAAGKDDDRTQLVTRCVQSGECLVLSDGESVLGFAIRRPAHFFGRDFVELLVVDAAHHRAGIGRALLQAAWDSAGTDQVFTSANASNAAMRSLLADEEWSSSGELTGLDEGDPELVFFKLRRQA